MSKTGFGQTTISGEVKKTTGSAVLFELDSGTEIWVPRSVCLDGDAADEGDTDLAVADWWLEKEGVTP